MLYIKEKKYKELSFIIATDKETGEKFFCHMNVSLKNTDIALTPFTGKFFKKYGMYNQEQIDQVFYLFQADPILDKDNYTFEVIKKELPYNKRRPNKPFKQFLIKAYMLMSKQFTHQWKLASKIIIPPEVNRLYRDYYNMKVWDIDEYPDRKLRFLRSLTRIGLVEFAKIDDKWMVRHGKSVDDLLQSTDREEKQTGIEIITDVF